MPRAFRFPVLVLLLALGAAALFLLARSPSRSSPVPHTQDAVVLQGIEPLEIVAVEYARDLDFGKGKFALFWFHVPQGEDFRIERLVVRKEGASDEEMPEAWLRVNSVRVYTKPPFVKDEASFTVFPPEDPKDIPMTILENQQETEQLLQPTADLPRTFSSGSSVSLGIYGKWADSITPRPVASGIRFCLEEISGTLIASGKNAATRFAQPLCWPRLGIK